MPHTIESDAAMELRVIERPCVASTIGITRHKWVTVEVNGNYYTRLHRPPEGQEPEEHLKLAIKLLREKSEGVAGPKKILGGGKIFDGGYHGAVVTWGSNSLQRERSGDRPNDQVLRKKIGSVRTLVVTAHYPLRSHEGA